MDLCRTNYSIPVKYYYCECPSLMKLHSDGKTCIDINECTGNLHQCSENQTCENIMITKTSNDTMGYRCPCKAGYEYNEIEEKCYDKDECEEQCSGPGTICVNTLGNYTCSCKTGFQLTANQTECVDTDECLGSNPCGAVGNCTNSPGSFTCACPLGYYFASGTCTDIDECAGGNLTSCMPPEKNCINTKGGYNCTCNSQLKYDWLDPITQKCQSMPS